MDKPLPKEIQPIESVFACPCSKEEPKLVNEGVLAMANDLADDVIALTLGRNMCKGAAARAVSIVLARIVMQTYQGKERDRARDEIHDLLNAEMDKSQ